MTDRECRVHVGVAKVWPRPDKKLERITSHWGSSIITLMALCQNNIIRLNIKASLASYSCYTASNKNLPALGQCYLETEPTDDA